MTTPRPDALCPTCGYPDPKHSPGCPENLPRPDALTLAAMDRATRPYIDGYDHDAPVPDVGSRWVWEPGHPTAEERVTVDRVDWNGEEWWVTVNGSPNSLARFWEAVVPDTPRPTDLTEHTHPESIPPCPACERAARADAERERAALREFAEAVARQWGYVSGGRISAGGLSTLEDAFDILGWDDPHPLDQGDPAMCDEPGCGAATSSGWPSPSGYRHTCHEHSDWHVQRKCNWPAGSDHWKARAALSADATPEGGEGLDRG